MSVQIMILQLYKNFQTKKNCSCYYEQLNGNIIIRIKAKTRVVIILHIFLILDKKRSIQIRHKYYLEKWKD